jgi:sulfite reductase (NADPH) flavoprotein alpha-component
LEVEPRHDPRRIDAFLAATPEDVAIAPRVVLEASVLPDCVDGPFDPARFRPLAHREYSIASIMESRRVELLVRQCTAEDGFLGLGSGWLTEIAPLGGIIRARIRSNPAFHPPADPSTPLILIGNGTGLAGLLVHLRHRAVSGGGPTWLFWGERHPDHDDLHGEELRDLRANGTLEVLEYAWSRLSGRQSYIQDKVTASATMVRQQVEAGAAIYVCGSVRGMAPAVDRVLRDIIGDMKLEQMAEQGKYRRDIY